MAYFSKCLPVSFVAFIGYRLGTLEIQSTLLLKSTSGGSTGLLLWKLTLDYADGRSSPEARFVFLLLVPRGPRQPSVADSALSPITYPRCR